jgi:hypothetical protein
LKEKAKMPHWGVEQIRVLIAPNSQIVMFITVAIDFLVQPKGQSRPPIRVANKKTENKVSYLQYFIAFGRWSV